MEPIGFGNSKKEESSFLYVEEQFTNAICYGKTGSGKTTGFILPNIKNRIKNNHGVLIYDFKGSLASQVKVICKKEGKLEDVYELGTPWGIKVNLLENTTSKMLRDLIYSICGSREPYWSNSAANLVEAIYIIYKNMNNITQIYEDLNYKENSILIKRYKLSLKNLYKNICDAKSLNNFFDYLKGDIEIIKYFLEYKKLSLDNDNFNIINNVAEFMQNIDDAKSSISEYDGLSENNSEVGGKYGVLSVLSTSLSFVVNNDYIHENQFNIVRALRDKKIVIINVSNMNSLIASFLNMTIYKGLQNDILNNNLTNVTIFIDEAQKVLKPEYLPDVDLCRESCFEYILSTQDKLLLDSKIGIHKTEELLRNIVKQYSFSSNDPVNGTSELNSYEYKDLITNKTKKAEKVYLTDDEIFESEYQYQADKEIQNSVDINCTDKFILKYSPSLFEEKKVFILFKNGDYIIVDYFNNNNMQLNKYNNFTKYNKPDKSDLRKYSIYNMFKEDCKVKLKSYNIKIANKQELKMIYKKVKRDCIPINLISSDYKNAHKVLRKNYTNEVKNLLDKYNDEIKKIKKDAINKYQITKKNIKRGNYEIPNKLIPKILKLIIKSKSCNQTKSIQMDDYIDLFKEDQLGNIEKDTKNSINLLNLNNRILSLQNVYRNMESRQAQYLNCVLIVIEDNKKINESLKYMKNKMEKMEIKMNNMVELPF